jgi:hypothetical protein
MMTRQTLGAATAAVLEQTVRGELIRPGHGSYVRACTVRNGVHERHTEADRALPWVGDVVEALRFAHK